jgi:hypothetical protein
MLFNRQETTRRLYPKEALLLDHGDDPTVHEQRPDHGDRARLRHIFRGYSPQSSVARSAHLILSRQTGLPRNFLRVKNSQSL